MITWSWDPVNESYHCNIHHEDALVCPCPDEVAWHNEGLSPYVWEDSRAVKLFLAFHLEKKKGP